MNVRRVDGHPGTGCRPWLVAEANGRHIPGERGGNQFLVQMLGRTGSRQSGPIARAGQQVSSYEATWQADADDQRERDRGQQLLQYLAAIQ